MTLRKLISDRITRLLSRLVGIPYQAVLHRSFFLAFSLALVPSYAATQAQNPSKPEQADEVIRVRTELVQTDVMVFDKKGHFVDGLRPEQFKLSLDGQAHTISIFERVTSGSKREAAQLATMRAASPAVSNQGKPKIGVGYSTSGRLIFFFVDDVHLSGESLVRARKTILHFVENRMNPGDKLAIVSTSGQIGFLQQLTDNPAVLRTAISRLNYKRNPEGYAGKTRITDYMASQVADAGNAQLFAYLMESVKIEYGMGLGAARGDHGNDSAGHVYNAARQAGDRPDDSPNVWITAQVFRGSQQVITVAPTRIPPDVTKGPGQLPYWSEIALTELPAGSYTLNVTATDRVGGASSSQRISFSVE